MGILFDFFFFGAFSDHIRLLTGRTFPPIGGGVSSGATAPDRGDPLSPTTTGRDGVRTHTHIYAYTVHSGMATNTHKSTHSTQLHYCVNSIPKSDTCQSTSAAEHLCM